MSYDPWSSPGADHPVAQGGREADHPAPLRLPEPPPQATQAPEPALAPSSGRRTTLTAAVAALAGAVLGTAGALAFLGANLYDSDETRLGGSGSQSGQSTVVTPQIEANGEDHTLVSAIADAVLPAVVMVEVTSEEFGGMGGNGSGVVYDDEGHIITNHHVVANTNELNVVFADGGRYPAEVVGSTEQYDIAVLRVVGDDQPEMVPIQVGDSGNVQVGELAVAVGSPFGLEGSVTSGVVSSLNRQIPVTNPEGEIIPLSGVLQTDAAINPGNSGGPLVAADGSLIGINSAILTHGQGGTNAGVGFAIPANMAVDLADQIINDGEVSQPFLGVAGVTINNELAGEVGVDQGVLVDSVVPGTPAADAGLQAGDVITALNGEPMLTMEEMIGGIFALDVGDTITVTYIRNGDEDTIEVELVDRADVEE